MEAITMVIVACIVTNVFVIAAAIMSNAKAYAARIIAEQKLFEMRNSYAEIFDVRWLDVIFFRR